MPSYELTYIVRPLEENDLNAINERIARLVTTAGGEISARNDWGKRHLAYPIRKTNEGFYVVLRINLPGQAVRGLERALQLMDEVLRYLVVRVEVETAPAGTGAPAATSAAAAPIPVSAPTMVNAPAAEPAAPETPAASPEQPAERS